MVEESCTAPSSEVGLPREIIEELFDLYSVQKPLNFARKFQCKCLRFFPVSLRACLNVWQKVIVISLAAINQLFQQQQECQDELDTNV